MQISYLNYDPFFLFWSVIENVARDNVARDNVVRDIVAKDIVARGIDMMVLDQKRAVLDGIWWYWVSMRQYWLVLGDTWSL